MSSRLLPFLLLCLLVGLAGCGAGGLSSVGGGSPDSPSDGGELGAMSESELAAALEVLDLVNAERAGAGRAPLLWHDGAGAVGQAHNRDMRDRGFFDHTNPSGQDPGDRISAAGIQTSGWGENIARGQPTPTAVMNSWMNSTGHRTNILRTSFTHMGVGVLEGSGGPWWTQVFLAR